jgi:hemerythrin HHE cation binding domain-containing protein
MSQPVSSTDTIFQVLASEHRELEARFGALHEAAADDFDTARRGYPALAAAILVHLHAEATVLFPRLARIPALAGFLDGTRDDHTRIEEQVLALARTTLTPSEWLRGVRRLEQDLERLIEREEADVYPAARRALPLDESHELACALRSAEERELETARP